MSDTSLRQLAKKYADGSLDQESYRRARADYLEAILNGDESPGSLTQASYTSPQAVAGEETVSAASLQARQEPMQPAEGDPQPAELFQTRPIQLSDNAHNPIYISVAIIAGVLVLVVLGTLLLGGDEDGTATDTAAPAAEQTAEPPPDMRPLVDDESNAALAQLKEFLDSPDWSRQGLNDFAERWQSLPRDERETALETTMARKLADELHDQLLEERALQTVDDSTADALAGQEKIVDFANVIGLQDRRLEVAE